MIPKIPLRIMWQLPCLHPSSLRETWGIQASAFIQCGLVCSLPPPDRNLSVNCTIVNSQNSLIKALNYSWAVYGFNSGHFLLTISKRNLPFSVVLVCDPFKYCRALFHEFSPCPTVLPSAGALLDRIHASGKQVLLDGYLIHSHCYKTNEPSTTFWGIQTSIDIQLRLIWKLNLFIAFVHPDHAGRSVSKLVRQLTSLGWVLS
jgi:hypothetical protein